MTDRITQNDTPIRTWHEHKGEVVAEKEGAVVIDCAPCGFKHHIPLPSEDSLESFYRDGFYEKLWPEYIQRQSEDREWYDMKNSELYTTFDDLLSPDCRRTILDIGSGPGFFLDVGVRRGWHAVGVEASAAACRFATDVLKLEHVHNAMFGAHNYDQFGTFSVVNMRNVIEHVADPLRMLHLAGEILEPDGLVCITAPNDFSVLQQTIVDLNALAQWWVAPSEHVNYFSPESLAHLIERCGYAVVRLMGSFPLELFVLMGDNYITSEETGREVHRKRMALEWAFERAGRGWLRRKLYSAMIEMGVGREFTVVARRSRTTKNPKIDK